MELLHDIPETIPETQEDFIHLLEKYSSAYYNQEPLISDQEFDYLVNVYETKYGKYTQIGASPVENDFYRKKIRLPFYMGSQNKIKTDHELNNWKIKYPGPYIILHKIDGNSNLLYKGKMMTRGNGVEGTDISHLIQYIPTIPKLSKDCGFAIRGELVLPKKDFEEYATEHKVSNARNMANGIILRKTTNPSLVSKIIMLAYDVYGDLADLKYSEKLSILKELGFKIPPVKIVDDISIEYLNTYLEESKQSSSVEIDGLVITSDFKEYSHIPDENPKYSVAFKGIGVSDLTEVIRVEWNVSKTGLLKPRVNFKIVNLSGADISWATGHNAKFIVDNRIGPGAILEITRSGDTIPYIKSVVDHAEPQLPEIPYKWNENKIEFIAFDATDEMSVKQIVSFFKVLGAEYLGESTIEKIYYNGFDGLFKILIIEMKELLKIPTIQRLSAQRILDNILIAIKTASKELHLLMTASNLFPGLAEKKLKIVTDAFPNLLEKKITRDMIIQLSGFQEISANKIIEGLPKFREFYEKIKILFPVDSIQKDTSEQKDETNTRLKDKTIVFTGVRDKTLEKEIEKLGGRVTTSVSKKTNILISAEGKKESEKYKTAKSLGIEILNLEDFKKKYL